MNNQLVAAVAFEHAENQRTFRLKQRNARTMKRARIDPFQMLTLSTSYLDQTENSDCLHSFHDASVAEKGPLEDINSNDEICRRTVRR